MSSSQDWSRFSVRINIKNTGIDQLYRAWATREGIEYWFLRLSEYRGPDGKRLPPDQLVSKKDSYLWRWHGYPDEVEEQGEILDCNGQDYFQFRFGKAGICTITIYEEQGEHIVELVQENIPTNEEGKFNWHIGCKTGWTFYLANMKSLFEGGIDLRNKNEKIQHVLTA